MAIKKRFCSKDNEYFFPFLQIYPDGCRGCGGGIVFWTAPMIPPFSICKKASNFLAARAGPHPPKCLRSLAVIILGILAEAETSHLPPSILPLVLLSHMPSRVEPLLSEDSWKERDWSKSYLGRFTATSAWRCSVECLVWYGVPCFIVHKIGILPDQLFISITTDSIHFSHGHIRNQDILQQCWSIGGLQVNELFAPDQSWFGKSSSYWLIYFDWLTMSPLTYWNTTAYRASELQHNSSRLCMWSNNARLLPMTFSCGDHSTKIHQPSWRALSISTTPANIECCCSEGVVVDFSQHGIGYIDTCPKLHLNQG